jgi:L-gulonate 5-dehydrogenase
VRSRLDHGEAIGADVLEADDRFADGIREWAGSDGPEVVFEATGVPELTQTSVDLVAQAGRVVVVSLSNDPAPLRIGDLPLKEVDVLGTSCCLSGEFATAVDLVSRRRDVAARLVTHEFSLDRAPEAIEYAMSHRTEVMKAVVRV